MADSAAELRGVRRAIVLSDSPIMRAGVVTVLPPGFQVVAELETADGLLARVDAAAVQLVVAAPADGGGEALFRALDALPAGCAVVLLLAVPGYRIQATALTRRFDVVCVPLNAGGAELQAAIGQALAPGDGGGDVCMAERVSGVAGTLSAREQEVLLELARGKSNRDIAQALWLSEDTIKSHLRRIYRKLGVGTRAEAVALCVGQLGPA